MGLPLGNADVNAVLLANAMTELLGCKAKRAKNRETKGHEVEAVADTCRFVLVPLRVLNDGQSTSNIPTTPRLRGDPDKFYMAVAITALTV